MLDRDKVTRMDLHTVTGSIRRSCMLALYATPMRFCFDRPTHFATRLLNDALGPLTLVLGPLVYTNGKCDQGNGAELHFLEAANVAPGSVKIISRHAGVAEDGTSTWHTP